MSVSRKAERRFRSQDWFDNPERVDMTALYLERFMNYGITAEELRSGRPIIGIAQSGSDINPCNRIHLELAKRVRESVTLVTALNPLIGYEKAALIAKTALASGGTIDEVAESLGIMSRAEMEALLVPEKLTQPMRLVTPAPSSGTKTA